MTMFSFLFYFFAGCMLVSALFIVATRNIIYAGFALLSTFFCVAAIYVFLSADFLAVTQLIVYVGGILVLLLFGVMLTNKISVNKISTDVVNRFPGLILSVFIFLSLVSMINRTDFEDLSWIVAAENSRNIMTGTDSSLATIGIQTMSNYVLPFEVISIVLLVALLGAAYISRRDPPEVRKIK